MTTLDQTRTEPTSRLWRGAAWTAFAALFLPRVNAVIYDHERIWQLDDEAKVMAPLVVVATLVLFAAVGLPLWRSTRLARGALVVGSLSVVGLVAFWISLPIALGGLAVTCGIEAIQRGDQARSPRVAIALGVVGILAGAAMWLAPA